MLEIILIGLAVALTAGYFIVTRSQRVPKLKLEDKVLPDIREGLPMIAGLTSGIVFDGNEVEIYQDGAMLDRIMAEIREAKTSVHFTTFVWNKGELEKDFVDLLNQKVREGVKVRVLVDYVGAKRAGERELDTLRKGGVELAEYHPLTFFSLRRFNNRMHRKILVVDGVVGCTFGHGIADTWLGNAEDKDHWRDTGVRMRGPAVAALQNIFAKDWISSSGSVPLEAECFPPAQATGPVTAHVVNSQAGDVHSSVALLYMLAIASARKEIIIQNPYFTPDPVIPALLAKMSRRGVDVHLMVPGEFTDSPFVRRAGQRLYRQLLEAGVRLYEFKPTLMHQKIVIVDRVWSHIGSTNFDARSLALNAEIGVGLLDENVAAKFVEAFQGDLQRSRELTLDEWMRRSWFQRVLDWSAYQLHGQI
ncbi:cardiolipin synthase B [Proteobacteria bacterium 005FR1]|nr:cardiolipin synthase B [Proteobacteria bacterium 005FR1]